jgi:two-component system OmpR family response regulator
MADLTGPNILVVDDDVEMTAMLAEYLETEGFRVQVVHTGEEAGPAAASGAYDAVVLDVMLPRVSGIDLLRSLREISDVPIIMLTAKGDDIDRAVGLELGADDYVAKPYFPRELVARLRAVLRRQYGGTGGWRRKELAIADLRVDLGAKRARCAGGELDLTSSEFKLLAALLRAREVVRSKDDLSRQVLGRPLGAFDRSIDVHVSNLRQKLASKRAGVAIEAVRSVGYRIVAAP